MLCSLALLLGALASYPVAAIGMNDDWSYVRSAEVLAETGRVVYNGWSSPMLGWQLFLGAFFAKLFGTSFTSIRASTLLLGLACAFLLHRNLVRLGVNLRNATIGTIAFVLNPLFLPLAVSFMTEIGCLFSILVCLYACLRAIQSSTERGMFAWLAFAALSSTAGGTSRQIAWLGVLVMFPCAVWLLRRRRHAVPIAITLYALSAVFIYGAMSWFQRQPYSLPEPLLPERFSANDMASLFTLVFVATFSSATFLLPILVAFVPTISKSNRSRNHFLALGGIILTTIALFFLLSGTSSFVSFVAPYPGNYVTEHGLVDGTPIHGTRPVVLSPGLRVVLTIAIDVASYCFLACLCFGTKAPDTSSIPTRLPWNSLAVLLVPFTIAYFCLVLPHCLLLGFFDRYLLPILPILLIFLLRLFEDRIQEKLPLASVVLTLIFAAFAVAGTHDAFSLFRAEAAAITELQSAGIPDTYIDGGLEHNALTQVKQFGHTNDPRIRVPAIVYYQPSSHFPKDCEPQLGLLTPAIVPGYALSFDDSACGGISSFAPIPYHAWMGDHLPNVYIVKTEK
jgi:hypothetical protein